MMKLIIAFLLFCLPLLSVASTHVEVKGLLNKKSAILVVNGDQILLKVGKTKHGVKLLSVTSREAVLLIDGQRHRVGLSKKIGGAYKKPTHQVVRIASQEGGHFWVQGQINGRPLRFVVDTGASTIAMNLSMAKRLGVDYKNGQPGLTQTANGPKEVRVVNLSKVTVGSITQYNVAATVSMDDALPVVLLGNSFLSKINMRTESGVLILESSL